MTDNLTTELCKLLEERGVKWWGDEDERKTHWEANGLTWEYFNDENSDAWLGFLGACESDVTPEQAIAATLGSDASAVRLAERLRSIAYEMRSVGASSMTPHELLACYANDVEKVADSLMFAATLGNSRAERTCKIIEWYEARDRHEIGNNRVRFSCGDIGTCHDKFCPECGARVVS